MFITMGEIHMTSVAQRRRLRKAMNTHAFQVLRSANGAAEKNNGHPVSPKPAVKERPRILDEDIGKLSDPFFFPEDKEGAALGEGLIWKLLCSNIRTIGDLVLKTEAQLLEINGIGPVALGKVRAALAALNLSLAG